MKVWEAEQQQKSIAVFEAMQASQQKGALAQEIQRSVEFASKGLVSKFNQKQREHRRLRVERLVNLFREWDLNSMRTMQLGNSACLNSEMLEHGMDLDMDNRRYLEIYNEWEDAIRRSKRWRKSLKTVELAGKSWKPNHARLGICEHYVT